MKRVLLIVALALAFVLPASTQDFTFLQPPTLAVMDFEVSMSAAENEATKTFYGQLISQALLTVLVQQNAAPQVETPRDKYLGAPEYNKENPGLAGSAQAATELRRYFPPIFKIFDKKYVELALQNNNFTTRDLYTKSVGAYAFTDLDYLVLGNVYETRIGSGEKQRDAIGFNVRVLNTKRAEELYSYSEVVDSDLRDLPAACARIAQLIMRDILNSHCAQFVIKESAEVSESPEEKSLLFFWQSRQIRKDDATVADSDDSHKRMVAKETFYWALPGQYVISVYNSVTQQIKTIPFTLAPRDIYHITIEKQHLESERGTITIKGVLPTDSYRFEAVPEKQREQYWWEIGVSSNPPPGFTVEISNGEEPLVYMTWPDKLRHTKDEAVKAVFRPASNDIVIGNIQISGYEVTATAQPSSGASAITGWWRVSSRLFVRSSPYRVDLHTQKDVSIAIADFRLQEKKALEAPRKTKVSFLFNPGFESQALLKIDDTLNSNWMYWRDKEKLTIESEYSQADWDALPDVSYTFMFLYRPSVSGEVDGGIIFTRSFKKPDLEPSRDTVVIIDLNQEALKQKPAQKVQAAPTSAAHAKPPTAVTKTQAMANAQPPGSTASQGKPASKTLLQAGIGMGYGSLSYYADVGYAQEEVSSGIDIPMNAAILWNLSPSLGIGAGALLHFQTSDQFVFGAAGTVNLVARGPSSSLAFLFDLGVGTGFTVGAGAAFVDPAKGSGVYLRLGYMIDWSTGHDIYIGGYDYSATNNSFSLIVGYLWPL
ncbi:MAG: hypothetical protein NT080_04690 [Spirochaetes bacterium]|nr:hypothetical protein [Spirochaetota bacterium]